MGTELTSIKLAFASGTDDLNRALIGRMREIFPELPLWVVSDFPPEDKNLRWIPWHANRTLAENLGLARAAVKGYSIRLAAVMLVPNVPFRRMRLMALLLSPAGFLAFNENLNNFMLRPGSALAILRHLAWRAKNLFRSTARAASQTDWRLTLAAVRARLSARMRPHRAAAAAATALELAWRAWQRGDTQTPPPALPPADRAVDAPYLRFLARNVYDPALFLRLWDNAIASLTTARNLTLLREAATIGRLACTAPSPSLGEASILALSGGGVSVFQGRPAAHRPRVLVASPYVPFPLSHGGAVRMYNLMRRAAGDFDQILICFTDAMEPPARELLDICAEIILVRREGSHEVPSRGRPDTVEEFDSLAFRAALRVAIHKWNPAVAQLEFTQMAQYAPDCGKARTLLVEHDVTLDLYQQMLTSQEDWEVRRQLGLWQRFERAAWHEVDRVVVMSGKDRQLVSVSGSRGEPVTLPNGVDLERYRPSAQEPEPRRILFIGSFAHLPNLMALEFFLRDVWPRLEGATLHIISGANHEYYLDFYRDRVHLNLAQPGIELEGFVPDVGPAYGRAAIAIAPLVASAGTNIKVLEAMAMARAVVSTPAGVNGLDLTPGEDFLLAHDGPEMATAITRLFDDAATRSRLEDHARRTVEREYGWDAIAARQAALYREWTPCAS